MQREIYQRNVFIGLENRWIVSVLLGVFFKRRASNYLGFPNYSGFFVFVFKLISILPLSGVFSLSEETFAVSTHALKKRMTEFSTSSS